MMITPEEANQILQDADLIFDEKKVQTAIDQLASDITNKMQTKYPLVLVVMGGSLVFSGQLLPKLLFPLSFNYIHVSRYGSETSGGNLTWRQVPQEDVKNRHVLVLDDILDEGRTMQAICEKVLALGAQSFQCAVLGNKAIQQSKPILADFVGLTIPDRYVFGFGMDVKGAWRNLPAIYALR